MKFKLTAILLSLIIGFVSTECSLRTKELQAEVNPKNTESDKKEEPYRVAAGDMLSIRVRGEPDMSGQFQVRKNGAIKHPLLGQVQVSNLTMEEVENRLSELLKDGYLVSPYVLVSMGKLGSGKIMIVGQVGAPGVYPLAEDGMPTILRAILSSGGFTPLADQGGTRIIRQIPGGKKIKINPRIDDIMSGRKEDIRLESDDLIVVPERFF